MSVLFFCTGHPLEHQHDSAARGAHVDGLIRSIENKHRRQHGRARVGLDGYDNRLRRRVSGCVRWMWTPPVSPHIFPYASADRASSTVTCSPLMTRATVAT